MTSLYFIFHRSDQGLLKFIWTEGCSGGTLPTAEILSGKNEQTFLVCGFLMKSFKNKYPESMKKIVGALWKLPAKYRVSHIEMSVFKWF